MLHSMGKPVSQHRLRFVLLKFSSLQRASVLGLALSLVYASFWLEHRHVAWLVLLWVLLLLATALVLLRLAPVMWRDLSRFRRLRNLERSQSLRHHATWRFAVRPPCLIDQARQHLASRHYAVDDYQQAGKQVLSAMQGRLNRLGWILIHLAVFMILPGALLDSALLLAYQLGEGHYRTAVADTALNEMGRYSRIPARSTLAFQAYGDLSSGQIVDELRIKTPQGDLARHLPFAIAIHGVELDARHNLQEDNFLTRISILDPHLDEPVQAILGSNRPFRYRGLDYHQVAVEDGGSELTVAMWPLAHARPIPLKFRSHVGEARQLQTRQGTIDIAFADLKPRNIIMLPGDKALTSAYKNAGPSLFYTVNDETGSERQFVNFMLPMNREGRYFFISGYRRHADEAFRYFHIPVDRNGKLDRFMDLHAGLYDPARLDRAINRVLAEAGKAGQSAQRDAFKATLVDVIGLFKQGGLRRVNENLATRVDKGDYLQSTRLSYKLVRSLLYALYREQFNEQAIDETDLLLFEDALPALSKMAEIEMPFYIQLQDMLYKPVVKLQVSYKPGSLFFFGGWLVLLIGLGLNLFVYHRRIWLVFSREGDYTSVTVAGMSSRHRQQFSREVNRLFTELHQSMAAC